jgi:hypothetical protein
VSQLLWCFGAVLSICFISICFTPLFLSSYSVCIGLVHSDFSRPSFPRAPPIISPTSHNKLTDQIDFVSYSETQGNAELRQQLLALTEESENTESELADAVAAKERLRKERVELERKTRVAREAVDETKERLAAAEEGAYARVRVYGEGRHVSYVLSRIKLPRPSPNYTYARIALFFVFIHRRSQLSLPYPNNYIPRHLFCLRTARCRCHRHCAQQTAHGRHGRRSRAGYDSQAIACKSFELIVAELKCDFLFILSQTE